MNKNIKIDKSNKRIKQDRENQRRLASIGAVGDYFSNYFGIQKNNPNVIFTPNKKGKKRY